MNRREFLRNVGLAAGALVVGRMPSRGLAADYTEYIIDRDTAPVRYRGTDAVITWEAGGPMWSPVARQLLVDLDIKVMGDVNA